MNTTTNSETNSAANAVPASQKESAAPPTAMDKKFKIYALITLLAINIIVFIPTVKGDFIWDDNDLILHNPFMQSPNFLQKVFVSPFEILTEQTAAGSRFEGQTQFYRPISILSFWLDAKIWDYHPAGFHLTNILIHLANSILFFFIAANLGAKRIYALLGAVLFSLYPTHFENVAWISGRTDLLAFFFAALSLLIFLQFLQKTTPPNYRRLILSAVFFFLSLLSKETCVFLFLLHFLFLLTKRLPLKQSIFYTLPYLISLGAWLTIRSLVLSTTGFHFSSAIARDICSATGFYTFKSLFPFQLGITIDTQAVFANPYYLYFGLLMITSSLLLGLLVILKRSENPRVLLALAAFYLSLFPSIAVLLVPDAKSLLAWRFLYIPSGMLCWIAAFGISRIIKSKKIGIALLCGLCVLSLSELLPKNILYGQSERDFWVNIKNIENESLLAQFNAASHILPVDGKRALAIYKRILTDYKNERGYDNYRLKILENLAAYYASTGELRKAKHYFDIVFQEPSPPSVEFYFNYASFLRMSGSQSRAGKLVVDILKRFPKHHKVLLMSAKFYIALEAYDKAKMLLREDVRLFNSRESVYLLSVLENTKKKTQ